MAVDTRSKRASAAQVLQPWQAALALPDGAIAQADRQHIIWTYSGILASALVATTTTDLTLDARGVALTLLSRDAGLTLDTRSVDLTLGSGR